MNFVLFIFQHVRYEFSSSFRLESSSSCSYDYVALYDGSSLSSTRIGKYCGTSPPPSGSSTGRYFTIYFRSDGSRRYSGFYVTLTVHSGPGYGGAPPGQSFDEVGPIAGSVFGTIFFLIVVSAIIYVCYKHSKTSHTRVDVSVVTNAAGSPRTHAPLHHVWPVTAQPAIPPYPPAHPSAFQPPPSYNMVVGGGPPPPPPYGMAGGGGHPTAPPYSMVGGGGPPLA